MKYCKQCGKQITDKKKFCNSSCAAKYNNSKRKHSEKTKLKIAKNIKEYYKRNKKEEEQSFRECIICGKTFKIKKLKSGRLSLSKTCSKNAIYNYYLKMGRN